MISRSHISIFSVIPSELSHYIKFMGSTVTGDVNINLSVWSVNHQNPSGPALFNTTGGIKTIPGVGLVINSSSTIGSVTTSNITSTFGVPMGSGTFIVFFNIILDYGDFSYVSIESFTVRDPTGSLTIPCYASITVTNISGGPGSIPLFKYVFPYSGVVTMGHEGNITTTYNNKIFQSPPDHTTLTPSVNDGTFTVSVTFLKLIHPATVDNTPVGGTAEYDVLYWTALQRITATGVKPYINITDQSLTITFPSLMSGNVTLEKYKYYKWTVNDSCPVDYNPETALSSCILYVGGSSDYFVTGNVKCNVKPLKVMIYMRSYSVV